MVNLILIGLLAYDVFNLHKKVDKNSKVVGNLKIDDLDDEFWED